MEALPLPAKFICLHRHPMDVIASGIEACPWGLVAMLGDVLGITSWRPGASAVPLTPDGT